MFDTAAGGVDVFKERIDGRGLNRHQAESSAGGRKERPAIDVFEKAFRSHLLSFSDLDGKLFHSKAKKMNAIIANTGTKQTSASP